MHAEVRFERYVSGVQEGPAASIPSVGTFHHVVATYDGSVMRIYVDGSVADQAGDTRAAHPKDVTLWIGRQGDSFDAVSGTIDELSIYDKELSDARIFAHYTAALGQ